MSVKCGEVARQTAQKEDLGYAFDFKVKDIDRTGDSHSKETADMNMIEFEPDCIDSVQHH